MGIGPVFAVPKLLKRHGLKVDDIDLWELNEAFAVAGALLPRQAGHRSSKLNVNGGSISIGHPFGMTGSRWSATLPTRAAPQGALRRRHHVHRRRQGAAGLFEVVQ